MGHLNETIDVIYSICCPDQYSSKSDCMASCRDSVLRASYMSCVYPTERKCKIVSKLGQNEEYER